LSRFGGSGGERELAQLAEGKGGAFVDVVLLVDEQQLQRRHVL
jgi:hypothetical protein